MERTAWVYRDVSSLQKYERPDVKTKQAVCKSFRLECGGDQNGKTKMTAVTVVKREQGYTVDGVPSKKVCVESLPRGSRFYNCSFNLN